MDGCEAGSAKEDSGERSGDSQGFRASVVIMGFLIFLALALEICLPVHNLLILFKFPCLWNAETNSAFLVELQEDDLRKSPGIQEMLIKHIG